MRTKLLRLLAWACTLALILGLAPAGALADDSAAHVILVEWEDENDVEEIRPSSVSATLGGKPVTVNEADGWAATENAAADAAWVVTPPAGYNVSYSADDTGLITVATMKHDVARKTVNVDAVWDDSNDANGVRPNSVQVQLLADGEPYGTPLTLKAGNGWSDSWADVPVNKKGSAISYTVRSVETPDYYSVTDGTAGTVTYKLVTGNLTITETMAGVPDGYGVEGLQIEISGPDARMPMTVNYGQFSGGSYTISGLLPGAYLARELNPDDLIAFYYLVPDQTTRANAIYLGGGENRTIQLRNTWTDTIPDRERNENPEASYSGLTFEIIGPDPSMPITLTYADFTNGTYTLENLTPGGYAVIERNAETLINYYTLQGDSVTGNTLTVTADGALASADLYNHYSPSLEPPPQADTIDIPVTKIWADNNNADGNRPGSITVRLYADGAEIDSRELSDANGWTATFMELPVYRLKDVPYTYSINEDPVPMYRSSIAGTTITNTYQQVLTSASVRKIWSDNGNQLGIRPDSVTVTLFQNGTTRIGSYRLSDANGWGITVNGLPANVNGAPAVYTWTEQEVPGYISIMTTDGTSAIFTNTLFERPPQDNNRPPVPGTPTYYFEDYETPLGIEVEINHVGDCFD